MYVFLNGANGNNFSILTRLCLLKFAMPGLERLNMLFESMSFAPATGRYQFLAKPIITLVPTHIKQIRTTAPRDMRAAREKRKAAKGRVNMTEVENRQIR